MFSWHTQPKPIIALSPMADMTDSAFCRVVKSLSSPIIFREMISSEAIVRGNQKTLRMAEIQKEERPLIQQLFGKDPHIMAQAAKIIEDTYHPEGFDINMGCPVYKITSNFNGAALMKEPGRAFNIVQEMKKTVSVPVSVKIRTGWEDPCECLEFCKILEQAGADLITIHGRTKTQGYRGTASWNQIAQAKKQVSIPVLANGDIHTPQDVPKALEITGCDGVMIARGALGNPWFFSQAKQILSGKEPEPVSFQERIRVIQMHLDFHCKLYGERGVVTFRKHLSWYFKGLPGAKLFRQRLHTATTRQELNDIFQKMILS